MNAKGLITFIIIAMPWTFIFAGLAIIYKKYKRT